MSGDGKDELFIGRRDGTVQIFTMSNNEEIDIGPTEVYKENFNESISSLQAGCVGANGYNEVVIATYSGKIVGLTTQKLGAMFSYAALAVLKQAEAESPKEAKMK
jgi:Bardet-Biedl syndrome 7 protein